MYSKYTVINPRHSFCASNLLLNLSGTWRISAACF